MAPSLRPAGARQPRRARQVRARRPHSARNSRSKLTGSAGDDPGPLERIAARKRLVLAVAARYGIPRSTAAGYVAQARKPGYTGEDQDGLTKRLANATNV